jgi:DNA modification methylase
MQTIPTTAILLDDRQRIDHSDTDGLRQSLLTYGTIQPLVLEELSPTDPRSGTTPYRLVGGGRRLAFLKDLGHSVLYHGSCYDPARPGYVFGRELTKDQMHELELEENLRRKAMTWQERALAVANLHNLRTIRLGEQGKRWTQRATGEMFGIALGKVSYTLQIADELRRPDSPLWKMDGILDAIRWFDEQKINAAQKELAGRTGTAPTITSGRPKIEFDFDEEIAPATADEKELARQQYLGNTLNDPQAFDVYWEERQSRQKDNRVFLTARLHHGSCIDYMLERPEMFDHIITDPPYAIDMDMLQQDNVGMDVSTVRDEHQVEDNITLLTRFFPAAYSALRDRGFLILWADYSMFSWLLAQAEGAGFKVQRWPIVWIKTHACMNAAAMYNFTKTTEIAIVCRKGNATLINPAPLGHIIAPHDDYKTTLGHPFVKPFACWKHLVDAVSMQGQRILDPFAGRGSAPLSFLRLSREMFACESNEAHYNALVENLKQYYLRLNPQSTFV